VQYSDVTLITIWGTNIYLWVPYESNFMVTN